MTKRLFDLSCCFIVLPVFGPIALLIAFLIHHEDGGSVLFIQERIGRKGRPFRCFKFRTMWNGEVTKVGRWLRSTGLDEVAQFLNVWRGEISVVGPRPLTSDDITRLGWSTTDRRFDALPGITGLAQLHAGGGVRRSLACDRVYSVRAGLAIDTAIVAQSFLINLLGKRRFKGLRSAVTSIPRRTIA